MDETEKIRTKRSSKVRERIEKGEDREENCRKRGESRRRARQKEGEGGTDGRDE